MMSFHGVQLHCISVNVSVGSVSVNAHDRDVNETLAY